MADRIALCIEPDADTAAQIRKLLEPRGFVVKSIPNGDAKKRRRIFLSREAGSGRGIANEGDVTAICQDFGFEMLTTERMTVEDQMMLFAEVGYLVGIHGAGLINMMFRRGAPLKVLEIFPPSRLLTWGTTPPHYCFLAQALGFDYEALITKETRHGDYRSPFWVDPSALRERIRAMLQPGSPS